jgi:perosamine synthetase
VIPLAKPVIGEREEELVLEVLRSGRLSLGPMLSRFEDEFGQRLGVAHTAAVSSGTAGLHLAARAAGIQPGDEVITSPFSFVASSNSVLYEGATPVFVDIDPVTLNITPEAAAAAVTERTTGLLPVHIFGMPADMAGFERLAADRGLWIVEDACEALGAVHDDGTLVGARGNPAVFAFYANKQMTTGEGGMVVCSSLQMKQRIDSERNQGRAPDMGWLDHDRLGFNYRLSDIACALGVAQLERLSSMLAARKAAAALYAQALEGVELPAARDSWFVYVVKVPDGVDRDRVIERLRERGVDAKPYLPAIHLYGFYRERFGYRGGEFPNAEDAARRCLALPFFPGISEDEIARVAEALEQVVR